MGIAAALLASAICAGQTGPASTSGPASRAGRDARDGARELSEIKDFSFSYAQPGFYSLLRHVKQQGLDPARPPVEGAAWTELLERPADFRGALLRVSGVVAGNRRWKHNSAEYEDIGYVSEVHLTQADQPLICKLILTGDASDVPLGAMIDVDAYFVTIQHYYSESKRQCQAAVFVGVGPTTVSTAGAAPQRAFDWTGPILATTGGFLIAYLILKRTLRGHRPIESLRASKPAPLHLADDLAAWVRSEHTDAGHGDRSSPSDRESEPRRE
ncbi:MAG: hypothetical protein AMXMBFR47_11100 [Planctomycetota bacterium]